MRLFIRPYGARWPIRPASPRRPIRPICHIYSPPGAPHIVRANNPANEIRSIRPCVAPIRPMASHEFPPGAPHIVRANNPANEIRAIRPAEREALKIQN